MSTGEKGKQTAATAQDRLNTARAALRRVQEETEAMGTNAEMRADFMEGLENTPKERKYVSTMIQTYHKDQAKAEKEAVAAVAAATAAVAAAAAAAAVAAAGGGGGAGAGGGGAPALTPYEHILADNRDKDGLDWQRQMAHSKRMGPRFPDPGSGGAGATNSTKKSPNKSDKKSTKKGGRRRRRTRRRRRRTRRTKRHRRTKRRRRRRRRRRK